MKYSLIYADPPWPETNRSNKKMACALDSFSTMSIQEIMALPVDQLAAENAVLFMWSTFRHLWQSNANPNKRFVEAFRKDCAFDVMEAWGFRYVTVGFLWTKHYNSGRPVCGPGYHTHSNAEPCLLGVKGSAKLMFPESRELQLVETTGRDPLAKKPEEVRRRLERMYPAANKLELFARHVSPGWHVWGDEVTCDIRMMPK